MVYTAMFVTPVAVHRSQPVAKRVGRVLFWWVLFAPFVLTLLRWTFGMIATGIVLAYALVLTGAWGLSVGLEMVRHPATS